MAVLARRAVLRMHSESHRPPGYSWEAPAFLLLPQPVCPGPSVPEIPPGLPLWPSYPNWHTSSPPGLLFSLAYFSSKHLSPLELVYLCASPMEQALSHVLPWRQDAPAQPPLLPTGTLMSCLTICRGGLGRGPLPGKDRVSLRVQSQMRVFT